MANTVQVEVVTLKMNNGDTFTYRHTNAVQRVHASIAGTGLVTLKVEDSTAKEVRVVARNISSFSVAYENVEVAVD